MTFTSAAETGGTDGARQRPLLRVERVSKRFGGVQALDNVSFELLPGEVHCLAGENGCGKSTLIKIVNGVYTPDAGVIEFDGVAQAHLTPVKARALGVQVIWQDLALFPEMTVAENIGIEQNLGRAPRWVNRRKMREIARRAVERLGFHLDLDKRVRDLSIAQRQMVAICRALAADARLVFMDEPTASLTQRETDALLGVIRRLSADGIAVVLVSHRLAEVLEVCKRVTVIRDGRLVGVFPAEGMTQTRLTELLTGRTLDEAQVHSRDLSDAPVVLEVEHLTREGEYEDVSFQLRRGEILGITGLLGAGRTELALTLFGMTQPDAGEVRLEGRPVRFRSNRDAVRDGIAYVSEDRLTLGLVQPQSIADNISVTVLDRLTGAAGLIDSHRKDELVDTWIDRLHVKIGRPEDAVSTLSGGNQQRIVLAKWLATEPKVLILDAPTVGVDVGAREGIFRIVRGLAETGMAILLISDEIPEVYFNADRVLHMRGGRIVETFVPTRSEITQIEEAVHA